MRGENGRNTARYPPSRTGIGTPASEGVESVTRQRPSSKPLQMETPSAVKMLKHQLQRHPKVVPVHARQTVVKKSQWHVDREYKNLLEFFERADGFELDAHRRSHGSGSVITGVKPDPKDAGGWQPGVGRANGQRR